LSASTPAEPQHRVFLSLGSNVDPFTNIPLAVRLLREYSPALELSLAYETPAVGSAGPNFLNLAAGLVTLLEAGALKEQVLRPIEQRLGRVRTADKYAPRSIDLDVIVFDGRVLDDELWWRVHLALPLSELLPDLLDPASGRRLREVAQALAGQEPVIPHPGLALV
jgi:2-amino-4-hydroxy-6-hydroxymethyldihydropteridine diphosphokinase